MNRQRLEQLLAMFPAQRVGVLGDFCVDIYWHADMTRSALSRETPRFPLPVVREEFSGGAAANVAWNLCEIGVGTVVAFTLFGDDWRGRELTRVLDGHGVDTTQVVRAPGRLTPAFAKPIRHGYESEQEDSRLDFENAGPAPLDLEDQVVDRLAARLPALDALLIGNQINASLISPRVRERVLALAAEHPGVVVIADSRNEIGEFSGAICKPNEMEAVRVFHPGIAPADITDALIRDSGRRLAARTGKAVFLTIGERGALIFDGEECHTVAGIPTPPPLDIVGAGDTFLAALGAALGSGATNCEAAELACLASAVTIRILGQTGAASPQDVLAKLAERDGV